MAFQELVKECAIHNCFTVVTSVAKRYILQCWLQDSSLAIVVTDGLDHWRTALTEDDLESMRTSSKMMSIKKIVEELRDAIKSGSITLVESSTEATTPKLDVKFANDLANMELKRNPIDKDTDIQHMMLSMANRVKDLEERLATTTRQLESSTKSAASVFFDMAPSRQSETKKTKPKTPGMSLVNPGSKKRKNAGGVQFD